MKLTYIATVQLKVEAETEDEAREVMRDWLEGVTVAGGTAEQCLDWDYARFGTQVLSPTQYFGEDK